MTFFATVGIATVGMMPLGLAGMSRYLLLALPMFFAMAAGMRAATAAGAGLAGALRLALLEHRHLHLHRGDGRPHADRLPQPVVGTALSAGTLGGFPRPPAMAPAGKAGLRSTRSWRAGVGPV